MVFLNIRKIQNGISRYLGPLWNWVAGYMRMMIIMISRNCSVIKAYISAILFGKKIHWSKGHNSLYKKLFHHIGFYFSPTMYTSVVFRATGKLFALFHTCNFFPLCNILDIWTESTYVSTNYYVISTSQWRNNHLFHLKVWESQKSNTYI